MDDVISASLVFPLCSRSTLRVPASHLSVAMTTTHLVVDEAQTTGVNIMTSPLSRGVDFYFQCAVVIIGAVGTAANAQTRQNQLRHCVCVQ